MKEFTLFFVLIVTPIIALINFLELLSMAWEVKRHVTKEEFQHYNKVAIAKYSKIIYILMMIMPVYNIALMFAMFIERGEAVEEVIEDIRRVNENDGRRIM